MFFPWQNLSAPLSQQLGHDWCCSLNCHLLKVLWKTWTIGVEHTFTSQSLLCSCPVQLCADISEANSAFLSSRLFLTAAWAAPCQAGLEGLSYRHRKVQVVCKVTRSESMKPGAQDGTEKPRRIRVLVCVLLTLMLKQGWVLQRRTEACWQPAWGEFSSLAVWRALFSSAQSRGQPGALGSAPSVSKHPRAWAASQHGVADALLALWDCRGTGH